ncbi:MAG: hypothetical protein C4335_11050 [Armatimonadota bacterium]
MVFYSTNNWIEANIVLGLLRSAELPAVLQRTGASVYGVGTFSILVPQERMEEARQIVESAKDSAEREHGDNGHHGQ